MDLYSLFYLFLSVKYTSWENLFSTSPHSKDGTSGKSDYAEALGFVNIGFKVITTIYSLRDEHVTCGN